MHSAQGEETCGPEGQKLVRAQIELMLKSNPSILSISVVWFEGGMIAGLAVGKGDTMREPAKAGLALTLEQSGAESVEFEEVGYGSN